MIVSSLAKQANCKYRKEALGSNMSINPPQPQDRGQATGGSQAGREDEVDWDAHPIGASRIAVFTEFRVARANRPPAPRVAVSLAKV
jgi:hypothetical protein